MTQITYIKSALNHSSAMTTPAVALTQFGLWNSIKRAFKKYAKPLAAIVGIAASIAVPFIAPAVAGFIFGGTALASGAIGAAIAGAGLGAAAGALTAYGTGQNVLMGAGLGLLGGGIGGGVAGYAGSGGAFLGSTADAIYGSGMAASAVSGPGAGGLLAGVLPGTATPGTAAASGTTAAPGAAAGTTAATSSMTSRLLEATLKATPSAIGTIVSSLAPSDIPQITAEMQAELQRLQASDINAYNQAKIVYDQLYARYQQIDPVAAAQLAEADVQAKVAGQISEVGRTIPRGSSSGEYLADAERRRLSVAAAGEGSQAYTTAYYAGEDAKTKALGSLTPPQYGGRTYGALSANLASARDAKAGLASDISSFLTPYTMALAPKDTTITSEDEERRRAGLISKDYTSTTG